MKVAFDCDGTLIGYDGNLRKEVCELLIAFLTSGFEVTVWSGGGKEYATNVWRKIAQEYNLRERIDPQYLSNVRCKAKDGSKPELAIDDESVNLGHFNLQWRPWFYEDKVDRTAELEKLFSVESDDDE